MKLCYNCGVLKEDSDFWHHTQAKDNLHSRCKQCFAFVRRTRKRKDAPFKTPVGYKWCPGCQEQLEIEKFGKNKTTNDGYVAYCRPCHNKNCQESLRRNGGSRNYHFRRRYGITGADADALIEQQGGICPLCQEVPRDKLKNKWHVDHDHETGRIRGMLCHHCNTALGNFRDDVKILARAIKYLENK